MPAHIAEFGAQHVIEIPDRNKIAKRIEYLCSLPLRALKKLLRIIGVSAGFYSGVDKTFYRYYANEIEDLYKKIGFEAVFVEYVFHSAALQIFPGKVLKILDTHDAFADRHKAFREKGVPNGYWLSLRPKDEARGLRRADVVIACQPEEAQRFRRLLGSQAPIPEFVVVNHLLEAPSDPISYEIDERALFLGSDNTANTHSMRMFMERVLPLVVREMPGFRLHLAGTICRNIEDHPSIVKLGQVGSLPAAFSEAPLSVNPMLMGTGINVKLLDSMAFGVATVTTKTGVRGLPEEYRHGTIIVDDDDDTSFAAAVIRLARDEQLRRRMGLAAKEDALSWNAEQIKALHRLLIAK